MENFVKALHSDLAAGADAPATWQNSVTCVDFQNILCNVGHAARRLC